MSLNYQYDQNFAVKTWLIVYTLLASKIPLL